jgi:uncharacterized protein YqjF (DUF2071 family)
MIDRTTPSQRLAGRNCGTQTWQPLYFGHWQVPADWLQSHLPEGLDIDLHEGRAYLGLVPFQMKGIRPHWLPKRLPQNFRESNLRTYCLHEGRSGVYFFSLDAHSRLAVWFARRGWSMPDYYARMQHVQNGTSLTYLSRRATHQPDHGADHTGDRYPGHTISFRPGRELGPSVAGTLEHFLFERHLLFTRHKTEIPAGQVHHPAYHAYTADLDQFQQQLTDAAGLGDFSRPPDLSRFSPRVDVEIFPLRPSPN